MDFLVEFEITVPGGTLEAEKALREHAEADAAAQLAAQGRLLRVWKRRRGTDSITVGLYRADNQEQLEDWLAALPLSDWMKVSVTPLEDHPNDPAAGRQPSLGDGGRPRLPGPHLIPVYRLEAALGEPLDLGQTPQGHRRIVALVGGTFTGPDISGTLIPGASADWQTLGSDGASLADVRYTLRTDDGALLFVHSKGGRHGPPEVLARLARGEDVDAHEYTFRTSTRIETSDFELRWMNKGVFVSVGGRQPAGVIYETYLVK